jgi:alkylhydroperoxidase/carboxymuconolactone decarboxylase family protein YurZ
MADPPIPPVSDELRRLLALDASRLASANINPVTGLATDYLNHFNEAVMMLEIVPEMPDCIEDFLAWQPLTYVEHFAQTQLKDRELAISAYAAAEPRARGRLDELAETMNALLVVTRDALREGLPPHEASVLAEYAAVQLRPLVAEAGAVINGHDTGPVVDDDVPQAEIDALLAR